jgi:hypothetical protein
MASLGDDLFWCFDLKRGTQTGWQAAPLNTGAMFSDWE